MIKCGMAETNITPTLGRILPGYYHERRSTGIIDELFAKAMVLDDGDGVIAIISLDAAGIENEDVYEIRKSIFHKTAIPIDSIMVCCTHSHTTGPTENWGEEVKSDREYIDFLVKKATDAAAIALSRKEPVKIGFGAGSEANIAFNRQFYMKNGGIQANPGIQNPDILEPVGPIDPEVTVIRIDDLQGNPVGVVSNYACHCDTVGEGQYCADFPGEVSRIIKKNLGENVVSMFLVGACGDINHIDVKSIFDLSGEKYNLEHYKKMGRILGYEALRVREKINTRTDITTEAATAVRKAEIMKSGSQDRSIAENIIKTIPYNYEKLSEFDDRQIELFFAKEVMRILNDPEAGKPMDMEIQVLRIGELVIAAYPVELFVEFGLDLKNKSPFKFNMISTNSNGRMGYVLTRKILDASTCKYKALYYDRCTTGTLAASNGYEMIEKTLEIFKGLNV